MAVINTPAIVLRHTNDRERDRLISVLTPGHGHLRLRARGTKRSVSKLGGSLEPVSEIALTYAEGRTFGQVTGAVISERYIGLRQDVNQLVAAQWLLELVERVTKPETADAELYELVKKALGEMNVERDLSVGQRWLALDRRAWMILRHEGFAPAIDHCPRCQRPMPGEAVVYDQATGFVHPDEAPTSDLKLDLAALKYLQTGELPDEARVIFRQIHAVVEAMIHHTLDQPLRSERVRRAVLRGSGLSTAKG